MISSKIKGYLFGVISAIAYGTCALFGKHLYAEGMSPLSVLFYRYLLGAVLLGVYMLMQGRPFRIKLKDIPYVIGGGFFLFVTCTMWFFCFSVMDSGIGASIMFIYPILVVLIMAIGFGEKITVSTGIGIVLSFAGVAFLCYPGPGAKVTLAGVLYVLISAVSYSVYIVSVRVSRLKDMESDTLTFYVMLSGAAMLLLSLRGGYDLQMIRSWSALGSALGLAFVPALTAFLFQAVSIRRIGATRTSILGALEPLTAVFVGVFVFHETFTIYM